MLDGTTSGALCRSHRRQDGTSERMKCNQRKGKLRTLEVERDRLENTDYDGTPSTLVCATLGKPQPPKNKKAPLERKRARQGAIRPLGKWCNASITFKNDRQCVFKSSKA